MNKTLLSLHRFKKLAKKYKTIPVYKKVLADMLTPVSAWLHLSSQVDYAFLFESVEKGNQFNRYSYLGINPISILSHLNGKTVFKSNDRDQIVKKPLLDFLREVLKEYNIAKLDEIPSFTGGFVGYLGYETISWYENIPVHKREDINIPDSIFLLFEEMIVFDHSNGTALIISNLNINKNESIDTQFNKAHRKIDDIGEMLHSKIEYQTPLHQKKSELKSNFKRSDFKSAVIKAKEYIRKGELFQIVISQRFERESNADPCSIYRALRSINPSPYMFHLKFKHFDIVGASPELLVKVENNKVRIRPIAGTKPRGKTKSEDLKFEAELREDEKENAEHLMLLDLGRNDVGKVSKYGTVKVLEKMLVEKYSHVMHLVSLVEGELSINIDAIEALKSSFPAGTVTGAPKIRAMEIINELENSSRGIYSGTIGIFDFSNNLNTCIAIRTMIIKKGKIHFQSGAGIVHDSNPDLEYEETFNKARAIMEAINFAEDGLVR